MKRECTPPPHAHINLLAIQPGSGGKRQRGGGCLRLRLFLLLLSS